MLWLALTGFATTVIYGIYRDIRLYTTTPIPANTQTSTRTAASGGPSMDMRALAQLNLMGRVEATAPAEQPEQQHIPETRLKLVLRGAFTSTEPTQGSALIAAKDKPSQRYFIDDVLPGGAVLTQVHANYVTLSRNGRLEVLYFPSIQSDNNDSSTQFASASEPTHAPLQATDSNASLSASTFTAAQSRAESIKQRLERLRAARRTAP